MKTIRESSNKSRNQHISLVKYRNLNNISHYHTDYELICANEGDALICVNENIFNLSEGQSIFINSEDIHYIESDEKATVTVMKINKKFVEKIFNSKEFSPVICEKNKTDALLFEIFEELNDSDEHSMLMIDCAVTNFCINTIRKAKASDRATPSKKHNSTELYTKISNKISHEYSTITFSEAADYVHFSAPYFSKVFNAIFGMNFTRYLNNVKIAAAIDMIKSSSLSMTEIAEKCGFKTIRSFNRVFKELTGYAPSNLPSNFVFMYSFQEKGGLDPTLNCTQILANYC